MERIYLDNAATTPLHPKVAEAMLPWLRDGYGNPSSLHAEGRRAKDAIDAAREILSAQLGCLFAEVLFTGSGTEAANLALVGAALSNTDPTRKRILVSAVEHHCVLHCQTILERLGYSFEQIPVDRYGRAKPIAFENDVLLVSVMHANNELGTINLVREIAAAAHRAGALFHTDAVQTFLSLDWQVADLDADIVTMSAHKVGGPKGVGAIYTRAGVILKPLIAGGGQEREVRGGTENVAGIAGFAAAVANYKQDDRTAIRDAFAQRLVEAGFALSVPNDVPTLSTHCHGRFPGIDAETMLIRLDRMGVSASSGAACSSGSIEPSHVLLACGYSLTEAKEGLRFTLGTTPDTLVLEAAERIVSAKQAIVGQKPTSAS